MPFIVHVQNSAERSSTISLLCAFAQIILGQIWNHWLCIDLIRQLMMLVCAVEQRVRAIVYTMLR